MTPVEIETLTSRLAQAARSQGLTLTRVHVEQPHLAPAAYAALLAALDEERVDVVIVPSPHHFAVVGPPDQVRGNLERAGVRVLVAVPGTS